MMNEIVSHCHTLDRVNTVSMIKQNKLCVTQTTNMKYETKHIIKPIEPPQVTVVNILDRMRAVGGIITTAQ